MTWAPLSMFIAVLPVAQRFEAGGDPPHGQVTLCLTILYVKPADRVIQPTGGRGMLSGAIASLQELALISCYDAGSVVAVGPTCRERKPTYRHRLRAAPHGQARAPFVGGRTARCRRRPACPGSGN